MHASKVKSLFLLLFFSSRAAFGGPVTLLPAQVSIVKPSDWMAVTADAFPDAPSNVCFPKLRKGDSIFDAVVWKGGKSPEQAVARYLKRLPRLLRKDETFRKIGQFPFRTDSGISGIKLLLAITREAECGPKTFFLVRYVFLDSADQIVCLGGMGDLETIDKTVISSLKLTTIKAKPTPAP